MTKTLNIHLLGGGIKLSVLVMIGNVLPYALFNNKYS